jgi:Tfp pilus assembly protein PilF
VNLTLNTFASRARFAGLFRASFFVFLVSLAACGTGPPVQEMSDARQAISVAREAGASQFAPEDLRAAENHLDNALRNLTKKEYKEARVEAIAAKNKALDALASTEQQAPADPQQ